MHTHRPRTGRTAAAALAVVMASCALSASCRSTTAPEASVPLEVLEAPGEALLENVRGEWIWVRAEARAGLVSIAHDGARELFWGMPRGARAVELVPITRVPRQWFLSAAASEREVAFVAPDALAGLDGWDDPLAVLAPKSGALTWVGASPEGPARAVALPVALEAFPDHPSQLVQAALEVDGSRWEGRATSRGWYTDTPHLVVLDAGEVGEDEAPKTATFELEDRTDTVARRALGALDAGATFAHQLGHAGLTRGADVVFVRLVRSTLVGAVAHLAPTGAPGLPLSPAAASQPLEVEVAGFSESLGDLATDLHNARWMSVARTIHELSVRTHGDDRWASWRGAELFAAAGYPQWTRRGLYADKKIAQAPDFLYVGRGYLLSGDAGLATRTLRRAEVAFNQWTGVASTIGQARARALRARAYAATGDLDRARALAERASERYADVDDWLAAGHAAALAAHYAFGQGDTSGALRLLKIARGYLFHSGAPRASADVELSMAEAYLSVGDLASAMKAARYALGRYERMEDARGVARAEILVGFMKASVDPTSVAPTTFQRAAHVATTRGDASALYSAVSAHVLARRYEDPAQAVAWLDLLREGASAHAGSYLEGRIVRALALSCAQQPLALDGAPARAADCDAALARVAPTPALFDALITRAWVHLQRADATRGRSARALIDELFDDGALRDVEDARARLLLTDAYLAALDGDLDAARALRGDAVASLLASHDVLTRAPALSARAAVSLARGRHGAARLLAEAALAAAARAEQPDAYAYAADLAYEACARLGDWSCAERVASEHAARAEGAPALIAAASALRARHMRGRAVPTWELARLTSRALALPPLDAMDALVAVARAALDVGDTAYARETTASVRALEAGLGDALYDTLVARRVRADAELVLARVLAEDADWLGAAKAARRADEALVADPHPDAVSARLHALYWRARAASDDATVSYAIREVGRARDGRLTTDAAILAETSRATAEILMLLGDASLAAQALDLTRLLGLDVAPVWNRVPCLTQRVGARAGEGFAPLERCARALPPDARHVEPLLRWSVLAEEPPDGLPRAHSVRTSTRLERGAPLWSPDAPDDLARALARGELQRARRIAAGPDASKPPAAVAPAFPAPRPTKKAP